MTATKSHLLCFGFGLSARTLASQLDPALWQISATSRTHHGMAEVQAAGHRGIMLSTIRDLPDGVTHVLSSAPPDAAGDPVLAQFHEALARRGPELEWVGYLSTTGVYGDHHGAWVDENTALTPNTERGRKRVQAEAQWLSLYQHHGLPVHIFRLAGIYGPGRNTLVNLKQGKAQRIIRGGQVFSRIHVEDIAGILKASMARPHPGRAYNVADDDPCPPQDVIEFGAKLLNLPVPPDIPFESAHLSAMARSFYADSKRVSNERVKTELGYVFRYPSYKVGLPDLARNLT